MCRLFAVVHVAVVLAVAPCAQSVRYPYEYLRAVTSRASRIPFFRLPGPQTFQESQVGPVSAVSWNRCGRPSPVVDLQALTVSPDRIVAGANVSVSVQGVLSQAVTGPLEADVVLEVWAAFFWIHVPCQSGIGSCSYGDICPRVPGLCPVKKGAFSLVKSVVLPSVTPTGKYRVTINIKSKAAWLACVQVTVQIF